MKNKVLSLILVYSLYIIAFIAAYFSSRFIKDNIYLELFFMDVIATVIIWIFSIVIKNTSLYDPYWSLTPWALASYLFIINKVNNPYTLILYLVFSIWSWRLTINWMITFEDLKWEDWRYKGYREKLPRPLFEILNLVGFQMMPTVLVYAGLIPLLVILNHDASAFSIFGSVVILLGILLELFADHEMHTFLSTTKEKKVCQVGLWKYSRHPNYLGENLIWLGLYIALVVSLPEYWYLCIGFIAIFLLFEFVSIPLMEKRQKERRSDYFDYIKSTPRMVPFTKFKK